VRSARLLLTIVVVSAINLVSIIVGFGAYHLSGGGHQLVVQVPVAILSGIAGVLLWLVGLRRLHRIDPDRDSILIFVLAFPAGAVLFTIVHYVVTGSPTSFGNIGGAWVAQLVENLVALPLAAAWTRRLEERHEPG
jgi:zinc transporter ZupT